MALLDTLSGTTALAAYSLGRLLRTGYAGSAFRVRRSSDSTEQDIGFSAGLTDVASLLSFCSGTNGFVSKIYDQSGNGPTSNLVISGTVNSTGSNASTGFLTWIKITPTVGGSLSALFGYFYGGNTGNAKLALYSDSSNNPGSLLVTSNQLTNPVAGLNIFTLPSNPTIVSGTPYWIGILGDVNLSLWGASVSFRFISKTYATGFPATGAGASSFTATSSTGVGMVFATTPSNDLVQATTGNQPQVVSSGALLTPIQSFPAANGGYMSNPNIVLPNSNTLMNMLAAVVNTGGTSNARIGSFISLGQTHDYDSAVSFLYKASDTVGGIAAERNSSTSISIVAGALNVPEMASVRWDGTNVTTTVTRSTLSASGTPTASGGTMGTLGSLSFQHDGWNGVGTGEPWTGRTSELILAAVMSSGDYAAAKSDLALAYCLFTGYDPTQMFL